MDILTKECKELAINLEEVGNYIFKISKGANHYNSKKVYSERLGKEFVSIKEAAEHLFLSAPSVSKVLKGKTKSNYYGLRFVD